MNVRHGKTKGGVVINDYAEFESAQLLTITRPFTRQ